LLASAPESAESHYWLALALQAKRDSAGALAAIDQAIRLAPNNDHYGLVRSMLQLGQANLSDVQAGLMDALALNPNQIEAYTGLIHIAVGQNNLPEAERLLRLAERVDAEHDSVLVAGATLLQAQGNLDNALKQFALAAEINPGNAMALMAMGLLYLHKDMPAFAAQAFTRATTFIPGNPELWRALIQAQMAQNQLSEAEQSLEHLLQLTPNDRAGLALKIRMHLNAKRLPEARLVAEHLHALHPGDMLVLSQLVSILALQGEQELARLHLAKATDIEPENAAAWQLRCTFESDSVGDSLPIIAEWLQQTPESAPAHEAMAVYAETQGDLVTAIKAADKALSLSSQVPMAQFVKLRQEIRENPADALRRAETMIPAAVTPASQRMLLAWLGLIHDRLNSFQDAAESFRQMAQYMVPARPLPAARQALHVPEQSIQGGYLLWAPTGARVERILNILSKVASDRLLVDRNQDIPARADGFGPLRSPPGTDTAGSDFDWKMGVLAVGKDPQNCIDWLPQWDDYTNAALSGCQVIMLLVDPRDAFLNWLVFGSAQSYFFMPDFRNSAQWLATVFASVADTIVNAEQRVSAIRIDDMDSNAALICNELQSALGLSAAPDAEQLAKPVLALGGMPNQFPAGHWRHYRDNFTEAFALLTPVAVRLGYPEV
jgi:tetratricopeptide (TPR) repeat protein